MVGVQVEAEAVAAVAAGAAAVEGVVQVAEDTYNEVSVAVI